MVGSTAERKVDQKWHLAKLIILLIALPFAQSGMAQTQLLFSNSVIYDQNVFRNYLQIPDWINQTSIVLNQTFSFKSMHLRLDYAGDLSLFQQYEERLFHSHQLGVQTLLLQGRQLQLNIGANAQLRLNKPEYNIYDYSDWYVYSQVHYAPGQSLPIEFGYRFRSRQFSNLPELSYYEHFGFLRIKHFFPTKTTFIGEIDLADKTFRHQQILEEMIITSVGSDGMGRGRKHGQGNGEVSTDTAIVAYNLTAPQTHQWRLQLKLAQSLTPTTGISLEYSRRFKPSDQTRYLGGQEYSYSREDELYDDQYTYSSHEGSLVLTKLLPWSSQAKVYATMHEKDYIYPAYANDENQADVMRHDIQTMLGIEMRKPFNLGMIIQNITAQFSCFYLNNDSNDAYFKFRGSIFSAGVEFTI